MHHATGQTPHASPEQLEAETGEVLTRVEEKTGHQCKPVD